MKFSNIKLRHVGATFFGALFLAMLILPLAYGKAAPAEIRYARTTYSAIDVLDSLNNLQPVLDESYQKALTAKQSNEQSRCMQTVVVAQLKYKDTSASNLPEELKTQELQRLAGVAEQARANCPELFQ